MQSLCGEHDLNRVDSTARSCGPAGTHRTTLDLDEPLARELVRGLVRSAVTRGIDPATRLKAFRTLKESVIAMSQDPATITSAEQLVQAVDLCLRDLSTLTS
ncbi:hypothetical protein [Methylobacterium tardum]|uniref:Uncharacterized protein n=1 Tax=Methylobacterium tardum TaxID=374432 RepID=A0AA37TEK0_9HYPH|nr:hypothetical protein [Methylobacterium tardum]GLS71735.1 hypothetical protein GCM10007890_37480 [Methylobacterium tardum]